VVPVATAQQLSRSFRGTLALAMSLGLLAAVGGLVSAAWLSLTYDATVAPGASIVLLSLVGFAAAWPVGVLARRRRRLGAPFPAGQPDVRRVEEQHPHVHGPECGHPAVPHDDHVDYLHDGHRHAEHGTHYDEH
jgi:zinc transport system permease protein